MMEFQFDTYGLSYFSLELDASVKDPLTRPQDGGRQTSKG
jgi:hypothetical protein